MLLDLAGPAQVLIVTQNIDSLHQKTQTSWPVTSQLIEVHGRMGLYHCSSEEDCDLATEVFVGAAEIFPEAVQKAIEEVSCLPTGLRGGMSAEWTSVLTLPLDVWCV